MTMLYFYPVPVGTVLLVGVFIGLCISIVLIEIMRLITQ